MRLLTSSSSFGFDDDDIGVSERYASQLASDQLVFKVHSPFYNYYSPFFLPWKHYVPVKYDMSDLAEKVGLALSASINLGGRSACLHVLASFAFILSLACRHHNKKHQTHNTPHHPTVQIEWANAHPEQAYKIMVNGQTLAREILHPNDVMCHVGLTLTSYARLMGYKTELRDDVRAFEGLS